MAKWTEEEMATAQELGQKHTIREIAQLMGRSVSSVSCKFDAEGWTYIRRSNPWTKEEVARLRRLAKEGKTLYEAAEALDRTPASINSKIRRLKIQLRDADRPDAWTEEEDAELLQLSKHLFGPEIARRIGRSNAAIYRRASALGITFTSKRNRAKGAWTEKEIETLRTLAKDTPTLDIALKMGKTEAAIRGMAKRKKISLQGGFTRRKWTEEEEEYLKAHYGEVPTIDIMRHLGRSRDAIKIACKRLGLKSKRPKKRWSEEDVATLKRWVGKRTKEELAKMLGASPASVAHKAKNLGLSLKLDEYDFKMLTVILNPPEGDRWFYPNTWALWRELGLQVRRSGSHYTVSASRLRTFWKERPEAVDIYSLPEETLEELNIDLDTWPEPPNFKVIACQGNAERNHEMVLNTYDLYALACRCKACSNNLGRWAHGYVNEEILTPKVKVTRGKPRRVATKPHTHETKQ